MQRGCQRRIAVVGNKRIQPYLQICKTSGENFSRGPKRELKVNTSETCRKWNLDSTEPVFK